MKIYIDEAGPFIPPKGKRRYSVVLAVILPEATEADLLYEFLRLRDGWPNNGVEIKGSKNRLDQSFSISVTVRSFRSIIHANRPRTSGDSGSTCWQLASFSGCF